MYKCSDEQTRRAYMFDDWTVGAFSESLEEKIKKLNIYCIPELPKDAFIKPRKRGEYWTPNMMSSTHLQRIQQDTTNQNNNSTTSIQTSKPSLVNDLVINNVNSYEIKNKINHSMNTSSNEAINDFILVELVI